MYILLVFGCLLYYDIISAAVPYKLYGSYLAGIIYIIYVWDIYEWDKRV